MKEIKNLSSVVTLVKIPAFLPVLQWPKIGDYDNPYILRTTPCEKKDGKFFNLLDGKEVRKTDDMQEWLNLTGTVFQYRDGKKFLLSRRYAGKQLLLLSISDDEFQPETMHLRPVIFREEKKFH